MKKFTLFILLFMPVLLFGQVGLNNDNLQVTDDTTFNNNFIKTTGRILLPNGSVGAPSWSFINDPTDGIYRGASHNHGFAIDGRFILGFQKFVFRINGNSSATTSVNDNLMRFDCEGVNYKVSHILNGTTGAYKIEAWESGVGYDNDIVLNVQGGSVGVGTQTPNNAAKLEISSTTQGVLMPRMTATQASAITAVNGLIVYVTNTNGTFTSVGFWGYEGGAWVKL